jgi:hypothetical protein
MKLQQTRTWAATIPLVLIASILCVAESKAQQKVVIPEKQRYEKRPTEDVLRPPKWSPNENWDAMKRILNEQRAILAGEIPNPALASEAVKQLWLTHHMSGLAQLPTPGVPESTAAHRTHVQELELSIRALGRALNRKDLNGKTLSLLLETKVSLQAEVDWIQTIGKWTAITPPNSPQAKVLHKRQLRAPFLRFPFPRPRIPRENFQSDVIGLNQCMVVVKDIQGLKVRLIYRKIPIWVEPWAARRHVVGFKIVWWVEYVPAEFIKRIVTCNDCTSSCREQRIKRYVFTEIREEPELLDFWRFY